MHSAKQAARELIEQLPETVSWDDFIYEAMAHRQGRNYNGRMTAHGDPLLRALSGFPEIRVALLFGSRASGHPRVDSDVDLAVLADAPLSAERRASMMEAIAIATGCPVDLVDLYHAPEPVLGEALKGVRLLGDAADQARLVARHVLNAADFLPLRERILAERRAAWIG
jgi:predicted nucleotidyltransferase